MSTESKRENDRKRSQAQSAEYKSQTQRRLAKVGTKTVHLRLPIDTIVGCHDAMKAFGTGAKGEPLSTIVSTVLQDCIRTLRTNGHIPTHADYDKAWADIHNEPNKPAVNLPEFTPTDKPADEPSNLTHILAQFMAPDDTKAVRSDAYTADDFSIDETVIQDTEDEDSRILQRLDDPVVQEVIELGSSQAREALLRTYRTLPEEQWGGDNARLLFDANLANTE